MPYSRSVPSVRARSIALVVSAVGLLTCIYYGSRRPRSVEFMQSNPRARELVEKIEHLAAAEPTALGIDTRVRLCELVQPVDRARAEAMAKRLRDDIRTLRGPLEGTGCFVRLAKVLLHMDEVESVRQLARITPDARQFDRDYKGAIYTELIEYLWSRDKGAAEAAAREAYSGGAFRLDNIKRLLRYLRQSHPERARSLLSLIVAQFRPDRARYGDALLLVEILQSLDTTDNIVRAGLSRLIDFLCRNDFANLPSGESISASFECMGAHIQTTNSAETVRWRVGVLTRAAYPELYLQHAELFGTWGDTLGLVVPASLLACEKVEAARHSAKVLMRKPSPYGTDSLILSTRCQRRGLETSEILTCLAGLRNEFSSGASDFDSLWKSALAILDAPPNSVEAADAKDILQHLIDRTEAFCSAPFDERVVMSAHPDCAMQYAELASRLHRPRGGVPVTALTNPSLVSRLLLNDLSRSLIGATQSVR